MTNTTDNKKWNLFVNIAFAVNIFWLFRWIFSILFRAADTGRWMVML